MFDRDNAILIWGFVGLVCAGCGGGATNNTTSAAAAAASFNRASTAAQSLTAKYENANLTNLNTLPGSGTASYAGYMGLILEAQPGSPATRIIGEANFRVNLAGQTISAAGTATDFLDEGTGPVSGTLSIRNMALDRSIDPTLNNAIDGELQGNLSWANSITREIDAAIEGDFFGSQFGAFQGAIVGNYTIGNQTFGAITGAVTGEKQ